MRALGWVALMAVGCTSPAAPHCTDPGATVPGTRAGLTAPARHVLGVAVEMPREPGIAAREDELSGSQAARRELGWAIAERALEPIEIDLGTGPARSVPRFQTWYDQEDLRRVYRHVTTPFTPAELDAAFVWNADAVLEAAAWPPARLAEYIAAVDDQELARGLGGISRTVYGPRAARHLLSSHAELQACRGNSLAPLDAAPDRDAPFRERRDVAEIDACGQHRFGPYFVAEGGELRAEVRGNVELSAAGADATCDGIVCSVLGPARVELVAIAHTRTTATLDVAWDDGEDLWIPCLDGEFPAGSTIVKADYRRVGFGFDIAAPDTSAEALRRLRERGSDWEDGVERADPGGDEIFTIELPGGECYRLVALHVMMKELDHWVWVTLFWSPSPDTDFGADRPSFADGTPWASYKMCAATDFVENDPDPTGGATDPSLAAALGAVYEGVGMPSWCSNPYLEEGPGNAATNCVGCHQHAGGPLISEQIIAGGSDLFRHHGRELSRLNFPADYAFTAPDLVDIFLEP